MRRRRARTGVKLPVENLSDKMGGHGSEIIVRGAAPCWIGHGHGSLAGSTLVAPRNHRIMLAASPQTPMISRPATAFYPPRNHQPARFGAPKGQAAVAGSSSVQF